MLTCTNIYITVMLNKLILVTNVSCKVFLCLPIQLSSLVILAISKKMLYPIICMYFQFYPLCFYDFWHINLLLSTFFSYDILFHALCLYLLHKLTSVYHTCTYAMMYCVCHLHQIYIFEIYTLAYIFTLYKLLILSSQKPYLSAPLIYVMKWVNMTYVLSDHVCFGNLHT